MIANPAQTLWSEPMRDALTDAASALTAPSPDDEFTPQRCINAETELQVISEVVTGERDAEEFMPATGVLGQVIKALAAGGAPPGPEGASNDDRLLLLKTLGRGFASFTGRYQLTIYPATWPSNGKPTRFAVTFDSDGLPIVTDSLRAALTEATHG